jgi:hypothetical protein
MKATIRATAVAMFALVAMGVSGCDDSRDIQNWVENTGKLRSAMENQLPNVPYRGPQHAAFKAYFAELNQMALALKNDEKLRGRFNEEVAAADLNATCRMALVHRARWDQLMRNCAKNRFFLCAEEVRAHPEMIKGLRAVLRPDLQRKFDQAPGCQDAQ